MNWNKIKEDYPKAWGVLTYNCDYESSTILGLNQLKQYSTRNLYDFFDEHIVYVEITTSNYIGTKWDYSISYNHFDVSNSYLPFKTRTEAETAAFEKAFEILENKLK